MKERIIIHLQEVQETQVLLTKVLHLRVRGQAQRQEDQTALAEAQQQKAQGLPQTEVLPTGVLQDPLQVEVQQREVQVLQVAAQDLLTEAPDPLAAALIQQVRDLLQGPARVLQAQRVPVDAEINNIHNSIDKRGGCGNYIPPFFQKITIIISHKYANILR